MHDTTDYDAIRDLVIALRARRYDWDGMLPQSTSLPRRAA